MINYRSILSAAAVMFLSSPVVAQSVGEGGANSSATRSLSLAVHENEPGGNYGATRGNGQGNGHKKAAGNGHDQGRGNGHDKYDDAPDSN